MAKHLLRDAVILEIGCGGSVFLPLAMLRLGVEAPVGIDYSWRGCRLGKERFRNIGVLNALDSRGDVAV